jgi:uncharacterized protein YggE
MTIKTSGVIEVAPDMASFIIDLNCEGKTTKQAKDCLVEKSEALNQKLLSYRIAQDDITTTAVNLRKNYSWVGGKRTFKNYTASTQTFVTIKNIEDLDKLYSDLLENKNLSLNGLRYEHSQKDSLQNEAYLKALTKAGVTADKVLKIGNVSITSSSDNLGKSKNLLRGDVVREEADMKVSNSITISNGKIKIYATLHVEYGIY